MGFKLKKGRRILNGPRLVSFHTEPIHIQGTGWSRHTARLEYMLFLKRGKDKRLGFVSGQFDPELSVRQLLLPLK